MSKALLEKLSEVYSDSKKCCELIGLNYEFDDGGSLSRKKVGEHYKYYNTQGTEIDSENHINFINKLRIPPAWKDLWIAPRMTYHIQATGFDSKGRKQYIYHPKWNEFRELLKYYRLIIIGESLPQIRKEIEKNLDRNGYDKEKIMSAIIKIIDKTYIRVGNEQYAEQNESYGITTMRKKHIDVKGNTISFDFVGKSGQEHEIELVDPKLAKIVKKLISFRGYEVFKYETEGETIDIKSTDVNSYLKEISERNITAKDFRTWGGTRMCFKDLQEYRDVDSIKDIKDALSCVITEVSSKLGNTKAVCRDHYINPEILAAFENKEFKDMIDETEKKIKSKHSKYMDDEEILLLNFLKEFFEKELSNIIN